MAKLSPEEKEKRKLERREKNRQKKWDETHKIINDIDHKLCSKCNEYHPATREYFYNNSSNGVDGLHPYCIACAIKDSRKRALENHEEYLKGQHEWYIKNKDYKCEHQANYYQENKEFRADYMSKWQKRNPEKTKGYNQNRRNKNHIISRKEWKNCKQYFDNACAYCGMTYEEHKKVYKEDLHKEHLDPNGSVYLENCVPSCRNCNSSKWEYDLDDWYNENNPNYTKERIDKIHKWINKDYKIYFEGYREKRKYKINNKKEN